MSNATTTRQKNAAAVIKAANAVAAAMQALKDAAIVAGQSYEDVARTRTADAYLRLPKVVDALTDNLADAVSMADTSSLMAERTIAGFPTMSETEVAR